MIRLPSQVNTVLNALNDAGYEAFLVGGAVRDSIRGFCAKDWDVATSALPSQVKEVFSGFRLIETGLKHGTVTVIIEREPIEITTYRIDGQYADHRRPDNVRFTRSLKEDMARRDFTMNALAYHPKIGITDFFGGVRDIEDKIVRCVGDPDTRFREDGLRILRAIRFASVFNMQIDDCTVAAIHRNRGLLQYIAAERIRDEMTKLLCGDGVASVLHEFSDVIAVFLPECAAMFGFEQHNPYHDKDVWAHTVKVVESIPPKPHLRWAALLHDIGKPVCFTVAEDGVGHFYGHAEKSVELAKSILFRLRFDNAVKERMLTLIKYHDTPILPDKKPLKRLMSKLGEDMIFQLLDLKRADTLGHSELCQGRLAEYDELKKSVRAILEEESCLSLRDLRINGNDLIKLGLRGKSIGTALDSCLFAVLDETVPNERDALLAFVRQTILRD